MNFQEDNKNDYFDGPDIPEVPKEPKRPALTPDDPRYWEQPEDEFEHLKPGSRRKRLLIFWSVLSLTCLVVVWVVYIWLFVPRVHTATQYGYVDAVSKEGSIFQTYEGRILPYKSLMDTIRPYEGDFIFSTTDTESAVRLKRMQFKNMPVRVEYSVYRTALPWRGQSRYIVTRVDSVRERDILPPDRQPETVNPDRRNDTFRH